MGDEELGDIKKSLEDKLFDFDLEDGAYITGEVKEIHTDEKSLSNATIKIYLSMFA